MCEYYSLLFRRKTVEGWTASRTNYLSPRGLPHGVRRLERDFNYAGSANPITMIRVIHIMVDPETGLCTSGLYKEFQL